MILRPAGPADTPAILEIWNAIIRDTTVTFTSIEKTPATFAALVADRRARGREVFVAEDAEAGGVAGFASYDQFRPGDGYVHAMEHTILLGPSARGRGHGRALLQRIEDHARAGGAHTLFAGVSGENAAGIAFHARMGFATAQRYPEAGRKFGRWLDLVLMEKRLG